MTLTVPDISKVFQNLVSDAYNTAELEGWHEPKVSIPHGLMMVVDEITEMLQEYRKNSPNEIIYKEMADIFIRLFDFMGAQEFDVVHFSNMLMEKMEENKQRPYRHGNKPF